MLIAILLWILVKRGHQVVVFTSNSNMDKILDVPVNQPVLINGVEVWYFEYKDPVKEYFSFIPYLSQSMGYLYQPLLKNILKQQIKNFDLIHTHMPFIYSTKAVANMGFKHNIPLFYQQRGAFAPNYLKFRSVKKRLYINYIEKPIMEKATSLIALNEEEISSYRNLGIETPCHIVPNGIDINDFSQEVNGTIEITNQFTIMPENFVILYLARLHTIKGAEFLLDVFLEILDKYPQARLILAGPDQHGLEEFLLRKVKAMGAYERVCIPGMVSGNLKRNLLARADLFCSPSMAEGFSISILEAMASATPILITPECNFSSIEIKSAGWVVARDKNKWIEKISYLIENNSGLSTIGKNAFSFVKSNYTWDIATDKLEEVYKEGLQRLKSPYGIGKKLWNK